MYRRNLDIHKMESQFNSTTTKYFESNEEAASTPSHFKKNKDSTVTEFVELHKNTDALKKSRHKSDVEKFVQKIKREGKFYYIMNSPKWKPILAFMTVSDVEIFHTLLRDSMKESDERDEEGNTFLHCAVQSACWFRYRNSDFYRCINVLMSHQEKLNMPNKKGYTAIGLALHHLQKACVQTMLEHPLASRLYLDYYPGDRESTVREILIQTYPELQPLLPAPLVGNLDSPDSNKKLLAALQRDNYTTFCELLLSTGHNIWYDEPYHSSLIEIACQMKNRERFVTLLIKKGASPSIRNSVTSMPLLHATARSGNFEVLEMLLDVCSKDESVKDNEDNTLLHWLARVSERKPEDKQKLKDCLKFLLRSDSDSSLKLEIDDRDSSGNTALCIAVERGFQDRVMVLLKKGANVMALEHGSKILLSASLSMLEGILDDCLKSNRESVTSRDYELTLKYQLLKNIVPPLAESNNLRELVRHAVVSTFLSLKWQKIKLLYFLDVGFYVTFVLILTSYIFYSESHDKRSDTGVGNNTGPFSFNNSYITSGMIDRNFAPQTNDSILTTMWYFLTVLLLLLTLREIFQLIIYRWTYIRSLENWLEILLIISTFIYCSGVVDDGQIRLHSSAVAIFLAWLEIVLLSGRLPQLSEQLEMLRTVSWTFLRFMAGYVLLLIAFALSFYILFKGSVELNGTELFGNVFLSFMKTILMFTGEFEASSLSFYNVPYTSHVIFFLFVVLMTIILLNLLNGLAVNDTDAIRKNAETLSLVARVKLISKIDAVVSALPRRIKRSAELTEEMFTLYPNRPHSIGCSAVRSLLSIISKKMHRNETTKTNDIQNNRIILAEKLSALQLRHENLEKKIR